MVAARRRMRVSGKDMMIVNSVVVVGKVLRGSRYKDGTPLLPYLFILVPYF